ncbi:MAG: DNA/RNA non-specific endonuclease [Chitinophagales bacterium]
MKRQLFLILLFIPLFISAQTNVEDSIQILENSVDEYNSAIEDIFKDLEVLKLKKIHQTIMDWALPYYRSDEQIVHHEAFSLSYNEEHEQANWVVHVVSKDIFHGNVSRTNDFRLDPKVSTVTADSADYWDSGYDRGHLAPSADFRWSKKALSESYFYSNMSPQVPELNREIWAKLENLVREWVFENNELVVVTGPVLTKKLPKIPQGSERVSIPELFYKVILDNDGDEKKGIAFIMPNKKPPFRLVDYAVSIDSVEALTGLDFFPKLEDSLENALEAMDNIFDWPMNSDAVSGDVLKVDFKKGQVTAEQAKYFIGDECTVCGTVVSTKFLETSNSQPTFLNLDKKFPDQVFTLVIFGKDRVNFTYEPEKYLYGKTICIKGKVDERNGTPQMIISEESAIEVLKDKN